MIMLVVYFILDLTYNATIAKTVNSILDDFVFGEFVESLHSQRVYKSCCQI